ncbi:MAG: NUDIX hydrolase [Tatlockia sp.]|nr:NUDIX hydrolase [Tatlockia sp.]
MTKNSLKWLKWCSEIQSIAQAGLSYCENEFDKERYLRLRVIAADVIAELSEHSTEEVNELLSLEKGYTTPKLDVRAFVIHEGKVLMVKERADGLWSLPGGWIDVNESPAESVIRETKEETGFDVSVVKLLALWDKLKHDHPPQWPHIYKTFFHCQITGGEALENIEISDIGFFEFSNLPPLSIHRITAKQIMRLHELVLHPQATQFD